MTDARAIVTSLVTLMVASTLAGCATGALDLAPATPNTPYEETISGQQPPTSPGASPDFGVIARPDLAVLPPPAESDTRRIYGLAELIDLAERANPSTRIAWEQARVSALSVGEVEATYLPTIAATVVGGYQRTFSATSLTTGPLSASGTTGSSTGTTSGTSTGTELNGTVSSVSMRWLLFDFGQREAKVSAATQRAIASGISFNASHQKIIYDVARQFYEYGATRDAARIYVSARRDAEAVLDAANAKYKAGIGTSLDVAQGKQLVAQAVYGEVSSRNAARDAYSSLLAAMGVSPLTTLRILDVSTRPLDFGAATTVERLVTLALARRTDVRKAFAEVQASETDIIVAERAFLPKIFMSASGTYATGSLNISSLPGLGDGAPTSVQTNQSNATVLGGIAIPIYDGGVKAAHVLQAHADNDIAQQRFTLTQQNAAHEVVVASNAVRSATESYRAATAVVAASKVTYDAALAAYKSGLGTITSALDAQRALLQGRIAQARAHATALIAAASLASATGALTNADVLR